MKKFITILFVIFLAGFAYSQSAEMMDQILETEKVTYGQISYLTAVHQNLIGDEATVEEAVEALITVKQLPAGTSADAVISLEKMSYLYLKMWPSVKGGFMCRITKGAPRYVYKQMKEDGVLSKNSDPMDSVSGYQALSILTSCMMYYAPEQEKMDLTDVGMEE